MVFEVGADHVTSVVPQGRRPVVELGVGVGVGVELELGVGLTAGSVELNWRLSELHPVPPKRAMQAKVPDVYFRVCFINPGL